MKNWKFKSDILSDVQQKYYHMTIYAQIIITNISRTFCSKVFFVLTSVYRASIKPMVLYINIHT